MTIGGNFMFGLKKEIRILVVDDDSAVLKTLKKVLNKKGYLVFDFDDPALALEHLAKEGVDLILTDLKMPQMDGIQFMVQALKSQPSAPVILITGFATIDTAVSAVKLGAFDYLRKPFEISKIYEVIARALESRNPK
jgi:DNA-binding NtrC family response regulator